MSTNTLDAQLCARMFLAGAKNLESKKDWINELNVFPVPDGDTGTNMTMTIMSAAGEVTAFGADVTMDKLSKAMSSGSLRGARGNSGVILSQLLRGFCKVIRDQSELNTDIVCRAFQKAVETAYKAVMKPKEGTILTVAKGCCEKAVELYENNPEISMEALLNGSVSYAAEVLQKTPDMLPVLKEAGVVDSGGAGLVTILQGALDVYMGKEIDYGEQASEENPAGTAEQGSLVHEISKYTYGVSMRIVSTHAFDEKAGMKLEEYLKMLGDMVSVKADGSSVSVKVSTDDPGRVLTHALSIGTMYDISVENLRGEDEAMAEGVELADAQVPRKEVGFVSVSIGEGLGQIFRDLGVDQLIEGGQTMNPSTQDVINAIDKVNADNVFVFPNNKNIIMAATQAQSMVKDKKVIVIPTKTIPQGIAALIGYVPETSVEDNEKDMLEEISNVKTGQLTYAVRNTHIDEKEIHQGDFMGVGDSGILAVGPDLTDTAINMLKEMVDEDSELISIYYGADVTEEDAQALNDKITEAYPDLDVEINAGGQPVYYYIMSVE